MLYKNDIKLKYHKITLIFGVIRRKRVTKKIGIFFYLRPVQDPMFRIRIKIETDPRHRTKQYKNGRGRLIIWFLLLVMSCDTAPGSVIIKLK